MEIFLLLCGGVIGTILTMAFTWSQDRFRRGAELRARQREAVIRFFGELGRFHHAIQAYIHEIDVPYDPAARIAAFRGLVGGLGSMNAEVARAHLELLEPRVFDAVATTLAKAQEVNTVLAGLPEGGDLAEQADQLGVIKARLSELANDVLAVCDTTIVEKRKAKSRLRPGRYKGAL